MLFLRAQERKVGRALPCKYLSKTKKAINQGYNEEEVEQAASKDACNGKTIITRAMVFKLSKN